MATFQERVEAYTGPVPDVDDLSDFLTVGAQRLIELMPESLARKVAVIISAPDGTDVVGGRLIDVTVDNFRARELKKAEVGSAIDPTSIFYVNNVKDPVFYMTNGAIYHFPASGDCDILHVPYPVVLFDDTQVANFPPIFDEPVILYAAMQLHTAQMETERESIAAALPTLDISADLAAIQIALVTQEDLELASGHINDAQLKIQEFTARLQGVQIQIAAAAQRIQMLQNSVAVLDKQYKDSLASLFGFTTTPEKK